MARVTIYTTANSTAASMSATQELVTVFEAALATLVADGASPTQAHVTAANNAYTNVKTVWSRDFVLDYDRASISSDALKITALNAVSALARTIG